MRWGGRERRGRGPWRRPRARGASGRGTAGAARTGRGGGRRRAPARACGASRRGRRRGGGARGRRGRRRGLLRRGGRGGTPQAGLQRGRPATFRRCPPRRGAAQQSVKPSAGVVPLLTADAPTTTSTTGGDGLTGGGKPGSGQSQDQGQGLAWGVCKTFRRGKRAAAVACPRPGCCGGAVPGRVAGAQALRGREGGWSS